MLLAVLSTVLHGRHDFVLLLQYVFDVTKDMDEVLVSLQQRDMKIHRMIGQGENLHIGFTILKVGQGVSRDCETVLKSSRTGRKAWPSRRLQIGCLSGAGGVTPRSVHFREPFGLHTWLSPSVKEFGRNHQNLNFSCWTNSRSISGCLHKDSDLTGTRMAISIRRLLTLDIFWI